LAWSVWQMRISDPSGRSRTIMVMNSSSALLAALFRLVATVADALPLVQQQGMAQARACRR
jgi:hypothetical protein